MINFTMSVCNLYTVINALTGDTVDLASGIVFNLENHRCVCCKLHLVLIGSVPFLCISHRIRT